MQNTILFDKFMEFEKDGLEKLPVHINTQKQELPQVFKNYAFPVNVWPVIINSEVAEKLAELCVKIPSMIKKIPELYFGNNAKKIANYYFNGNEMLTQYTLACHRKNIDIGSRLDLSLSPDGFKILEVNIGSSIGGWQVQSFETVIRKYHPLLSDQGTAENFHSPNVQSIYVKFLVDQIQKQVAIGDTINLFIAGGDLENKTAARESLSFFNILFKKELQSRGLKGQAYNGSLQELKLRRGSLFANQIPLNAVIIWGSEEIDLPPDVLRAFITNKVYFPDHLGLAIYGDKRNLGLLRELAEQGKFSGADNALILKSIPWTAKLEDRQLVYEGKQSSLVDLLQSRREDFVLKPSQGKQGKDVFVGRFMAPEAWEGVIANGLRQGGFIAQEYIDASDFIAPNKNNEWTPHKLIWGAFGFGQQYGGVWVRMSEIGTDNGVINSATGAVEAIVFETAQ